MGLVDLSVRESKQTNVRARKNCKHTGTANLHSARLDVWASLAQRLQELLRVLRPRGIEGSVAIQPSITDAVVL